ncbi:chaperone protein dnaJ 20, chloroplastic [Lathyrus oleraceus]|uniref:chaperone protein dnaJ 20, chloroplastic n=1 Tax=Pisum sativum TaxID=3888 RepID=UPI0021CFAFEC|nr:chaperone protein dnaJ 20, chloroplastic-like [Pisum sativum]
MHSQKQRQTISKMDVLLSLNSSSSSSLINISKPYKHHHNFPLSNNHQRQPRTKQFSVTCRATKSDGNLYKILCLSSNTATTTDDIKRAYRTMALQYHPDVFRDGLKKEESTKMFVQVNEAYKTMSNPKLKEEYDSELFGLGNLRRSKWMEQMVELNRKSDTRKGGSASSSSWGSRMRARNNSN